MNNTKMLAAALLAISSLTAACGVAQAPEIQRETPKVVEDKRKDFGNELIPADARMPADKK